MTATDFTLTPLDRAIVTATQSGLPICDEPYRIIAEIVGSTPEEVMHRLKSLQARGALRRIGVVPNHYALGFVGNGMTVWDVEDRQVLELGQAVGALDFVSHAYLRPRYLPDWPYNLFAMAHGKSRDEVRSKAQVIREILGEACRNGDVLFSTHILKKTGLRLIA